MEALPLPDGLKVVPRPMLEEYVLERIRQFSRVYTSQLLGKNAGSAAVDTAFNNAVSILGASTPRAADESYVLRFTHKCKFLGCRDKECALCVNNPNKTCSCEDNFDECYANDQVLKSKCEADVYLELLSTNGQRHDASKLELQMCVIDGESLGTGQQPRLDTAKELLKSDDGNVLIGSYVTPGSIDAHGRLHLRLEDGAVQLPDVHIKDKNDTFRLHEETYSTFRLMAVAIQRDMYGNAVVLDNVVPAISQKFNVKTQRALNDYRKSEFPHYRDELTKLKYIGSITATRLKDVQAFVADVPFTAIETVEQMKHLLMYADQNRTVENKLLELLNMKGKHKHKWDFLREVLTERIVYDDMVHRAWFTDDSMTQGLLYACKQGQVNLEKPFGLAQRAVSGGQVRLQVLSPSDAQSQEVMRAWRAAADDAWATPGHPGWTVVTEPLELVNAGTSTPASHSAPLSRLGPRPSCTMDVDGGADSGSPRHSSSQPRMEKQASHAPSSPLYSSRPNSSAKSAELPPAFTFTSPGRSPTRIKAHMATPPIAAKPDPYGPYGADDGHDTRFDVKSLRTNSSPSLMVQHPFAHAAGLPCSGGGGGGSVGEFNAGASEPYSPLSIHHRAGSSRLRRMSASAAKPFRLHTEHSAPPSGCGMFDDGGLLNELATCKRPRGSVPSGPPPPASIVGVPGAPSHEPAVGMDNPFATRRGSSRMELYHQESRGRHMPRARPEGADCASPSSPRLQVMHQHAEAAYHTLTVAASPPSPPHAVDMDELLARGMDAASPVDLVTVPGSPSAMLSVSMRQSLDLGNGGGQGGPILMLQPHAGSPMDLGPGTGGSARPPVMQHADSFNKQLNRFLKHSESDSFKLDDPNFTDFLNDFADSSGMR